MNVIDVKGFENSRINEAIREADGDITLKGCCGQRFIAAGMGEKNIVIDGIPGNALGAYLNGGNITVNGNAQDAVGDTMNSGTITVNGSIGDAAGYAMRGGKIFVKGNAGYRAGIHMKEYREKCPVMVIGGKCGSFLGEYQAGGIIIVLGLGSADGEIVHNFPCTGMHGGKMLLRSDCKNVVFPKNVKVSEASAGDLEDAEPYIEEFCTLFGYDKNEIMSGRFTLVVPDTANLYKQMYAAN